MEKKRKPRLKMEFRGSLSVLKTIVSQSIDPDPNVRVALVMPGGVQRGVYLTGAVEVIQRSGITNGINEIHCNSSGAAAAMCLVADAASARTTHFLENIEKELMRLGRFNPFLNIKGLSDTFEFTHKVNADTIRNSSTRLMVGLTDFKTGEEIVVDAGKSTDHPLRTVVKSMTWPFITNAPVTQDENGRELGDGWLANPIPLKGALRATHVLVISPNSLSERLITTPKITSAISSLVNRGLLPELARLLTAFPERFNAGQEEIMAYTEGRGCQAGVEVAVIAPTSPISRYSMNGPELRRAQSQSKIFTADCFRRAGSYY